MTQVIGWNVAIGDRKIFQFSLKKKKTQAYMHISLEKAHFLYFIVRDIFTMIQYRLFKQAIIF